MWFPGKPLAPPPPPPPPSSTSKKVVAKQTVNPPVVATKTEPKPHDGDRTVVKLENPNSIQQVIKSGISGGVDSNYNVSDNSSKVEKTVKKEEGIKGKEGK